MYELKFLHPSFRHGMNTTIRRGVKWDLRNGQTAYILLENETLTHFVIRTRVMRFCDLTNDDLVWQHDKETRNLSGLFGAMRRAYPDFDEREIVTIVTFEME